MKVKKDKKKQKFSKDDSLKNVVKSTPFKQDGQTKKTKKKKNLKRLTKNQHNDKLEEHSIEQFVDLTEQQECEVDLINDQFEGVDKCEDEVEVEKQKTPKKTKIPKIRRSARDENVDDNFMIVPWASK